jgi:GT2 family glycosyltransferase
MKKLSIVTGTVERPQALRRFVGSVFEHATPGIDWELIIADASRNPTFVKHPNVKTIHENPRAGHAAGYNRAFREAQGEYVVWMNDDAIVCKDWDARAISFMERNPWCGLGAIYYSEGGCCFHINSYQGMPYANFGILERSFGEQIGWFDEFCRMYGADNSVAFKTLLAGKGIGACWGSKVEHWPIMDDIKRDNVARQAQDARALMDRYRDKIDEMLYLNSQYPRFPMVCNA